MDRIVRFPEVIKLTGISESTINREIRAGRFPKKDKISKRSVGWSLQDILDWMQKRKLPK